MGKCRHHGVSGTNRTGNMNLGAVAAKALICRYKQSTFSAHRHCHKADTLRHQCPGSFQYIFIGTQIPTHQSRQLIPIGLDDIRFLPQSQLHRNTYGIYTNTDTQRLQLPNPFGQQAIIHSGRVLAGKNNCIARLHRFRNLMPDFLQIFRIHRAAGLIDIRIGTQNRIHHFQIGSGYPASDNHIIGKTDPIQRSLDIAAGSTAQNADCQRLATQCLNGFGDVNSLSTGIQTNILHTIDCIDCKTGQGYSLIQCGI